MKNVKTTKITYYVNTEKKVVVAKCAVYNITGIDIEPKVIRAKAKCSETDTFDLEKGKELARKRLELKVAKFQFKMVERLKKDIDKIYDNVLQYYTGKETLLTDYLKTL